MTNRDAKFARLFAAFRVTGIALIALCIAATLALIALAFATTSIVPAILCIALAGCTGYAGWLCAFNVRTIAN